MLFLYACIDRVTALNVVPRASPCQLLAAELQKLCSVYSVAAAHKINLCTRNGCMHRAHHPSQPFIRFAPYTIKLKRNFHFQYCFPGHINNTTICRESTEKSSIRIFCFVSRIVFHGFRRCTMHMNAVPGRRLWAKCDSSATDFWFNESQMKWKRRAWIEHFVPNYILFGLKCAEKQKQENKKHKKPEHELHFNQFWIQTEESICNDCDQWNRCGSTLNAFQFKFREQYIIYATLTITRRHSTDSFFLWISCSPKATTPLHMIDK